MADKTIPAFKILRGKVGINTATPDSNHNLTISNTANYGIRLTGTNATVQANGNLILDSANNIYMRPNSGYEVIIDSGDGLYVTSGSVGIGTNSPATKLDVYSSSAALRISASGGTSPQLELSSVGAVNWKLRANISSSDFRITKDSTDYLTILSGGSVGIGTVSPISKFHVAGNAEIGDTSLESTVLTIRAQNTAGAPAATTQIRMKGYEGRGIGTFYEDSSYSGQEWFCGMNYSAAFGTWNVGYDASGGQAEYNANTLFRVRYTGRVEMLNYGSGTFTGTPAYKLAVDSSGNIIETAVGAGQVDGSGTANKVAKWTDGDTIGNSQITDNGTSVGINQGSPNAANKLEVSGTVTCSSQLISAQGYTQPPVGTLTIQGPTNGGTTINSDVWGLVVGPQHTRSSTANTYYAGIAFNHLLNHSGSATYNNAPQAWIGTRLHDTSGSERDFLVFATKSGTGTAASDVPVERMCIDPIYGSIGIGTTDPDSQMQIGRSQTTDAFNGAFIKLRPSNTTNSTGLTSITLGTSTVDNYGYSISGWRGGTDGSPYLRIQRHNNSATGTDVMVMNNSGHIGIGTTDPAYKFELKDSVTGNWLAAIYNTATSGNSGGLLVRMDEPGSTGIAFGVYANGGYKFKVEPDGEVQILSGAAYTTHLNYQNSGYHYISMANSGATYFRGGSNGITTMTVKGDGKVGIKDTSPQTALAVNGEASFGDGSRLSLIGLSIASSASSPNIKIRTKIPFALGAADFTVNIKGFIYGNAETANLTVCWHYYNSTFYNATCSSAGGWAPTIQLSAEDWDSSGTKKVCICLSTPGYWVKAYVESMFSHSYNDQYTDGWTWVDETASGTGNDLASLSYRSDFGNNFRMLSNGCIGMGANPLTNAHLTVNGGLAVGDATYQSNMNNGAADFSVDCNGTSMISWVGNYLQVGGTGQNWNMKMYNGLLQTWGNDLSIVGGGTGTSYKLYLGTNGQTQTITCNNGSVGIGTNTPAYKLDVYGGDARVGTNLRLGNGSAAGNSTNPAITVSGVTTAGVYFENSGVGFGVGSGSKYLFLSSAGNASLGGNGFFKQLGDRPYGTDDLNDYYRSNDETSFCQFYRYDATHGHWANSSGTLTTNAPSTLTQTTSQIYSYGSLLTLRSINSFRGQFYFAHSASEFYWRSGWGTNGDQNWTRIVGDRNIQSVINNVGNISIGGVSSNTARLHINETGTGTPIQITRANNSGNGMIKFMTGGTNDWIIGLRNVSDSDFHLYSYATATNVFSVLRADGNVGIGDDTPENKLTVNGSSRFKDTMFFADSNRGMISWGTMGGGTGFGMQAASGNALSLGANATWDHIVITTAGNVGIGRATAHGKLDIGAAALGTSSGDVSVVSRSSSAVGSNTMYLLEEYVRTSAGTDWTSAGVRLQAKTDSTYQGYIQFNGDSNNYGITFGAGAGGTSSPGTTAERMRIDSAGNVGIASASPAATLDVRQGSSNTNNKLVKFVDDVLSVYKVTGLSNHTVTLTCGSYFQAEVVITANQTNAGTYNNLYIRGIWSNNHTSHHWDEIENIGSLTGSSFSITVGQNDVSNSGKLTITHTYSSGSFSKMIVRVTDFSGAHSYSIT